MSVIVQWTVTVLEVTTLDNYFYRHLIVEFDRFLIIYIFIPFIVIWFIYLVSLTFKKR